MPFYSGKSKDGSDMKEVHGGYINPNNPNEWSSKPYPGIQVRTLSIISDIENYMNGRFSLRDVYNQILENKCPLSKSRRDYVLNHFDENGKFKYDD